LNLSKVSDYLQNNPESIVDVLESIGFANISFKKNISEIRCSVDAMSNKTSVKINTQTLSYVCFSTGDNGNIYTAVMQKTDCSFPKSIEYIVNILNLDKDQYAGGIVNYPFLGFYKEFLDNENFEGIPNDILDINTLTNYSNNPNMMFLEDGIDLKTQEYFSLGYDWDTDRITIPQWNTDGELVGIMGRLNSTDCEHGERWLPIIPCSRTMTLYGFHYNYKDIQQADKCIIFESEKSVMQTKAMGINIGLATCGNHISVAQTKYIKELMVSEIILAYDEGLSELQLIDACKKVLSDNPIYHNRVGYIYDEENEIIEKGSKASPSDLGVEKLNQLLEKKVRWVQ